MVLGSVACVHLINCCDHSASWILAILYHTRCHGVYTCNSETFGTEIVSEKHFSFKFH